jgi:hypothetical protein
VKHPLQGLIDMYQHGEISENDLREEAAKLPEQRMDVLVSLEVHVHKTVSVSVAMLAEAAIDESGDVYNDAISEALPGFGGWDNFEVHEEEHTWIDNEGKEIER